MIRIKDLWLKLGAFSLEGVNLSVDYGEYFVVLGPSGAGKTVLLECIAGLHRLRKGEIWIDGKDVTGLTPEQRRVGYVPQDYVLFPFLDVFENIAFGLRQRGYSEAEIEDRVRALAHLTGISHLLDRDPRSLSGGEKQRVALARALAPFPRVLLLDEPLSSLDLKTAKYLRVELRRIHDELGITTVHVTHNQIEAEEMADRIAILSGGSLQQVGRPEEIFFYPQNDRVLEFIDAPNILECRACRDLGQGLKEVDCNGMTVVVPHDGGRVRRIAIFPRDVYISQGTPPGPQVNRFRGIIVAIEPRGGIVRMKVDVQGNRLASEVPSDISEAMDLRVGKEVSLILKLRGIRVYEGEL